MSTPSLLNRSNYSFLSSALTIQDIVGHAARNGHKYVVIADFENAHSWPKFYKEAIDKDLIPVFGIQINYRNSSLLFLAKNKEGFRELLKLSKSKDPNDLSFDNLIFVHVEGEDHFQNIPKYSANTEGETGVFLRENKFLKKEDYEFYCLLRAIDNNTQVSKEMELNSHFSNDYLEAEVPPELIDSIQVKNIYSILEQCSGYEILEKHNTLSFFDKPEEELRTLLEDFVFPEDKKELYKTRLNQELEVLINKGFCEYFLIVHDAVKWSKENGIYVGPGRGSVCGSLVAYALGITEIDPIKYELYFERFLNVTRTTTPDIDIDVANNKRDDLFRYLKEKYGEDNVALLSVYRTFKVKYSIREVCKAYGVPAPLIDSCVKDLKHDDEINFNDIGLKRLTHQYPDLVSPLKKIQNYPCNLSIHAAGVVISSTSLPNIIPLVDVPYSPLRSSQWEADELKDAGFIKFDFLALQYLQALSNIEDRVAEIEGKRINWDEVNLDDPVVYDTLIEGRNLNIFQFENLKIRKLIQDFKPKTLLDLALISSIHRPGASDQIPILLARKPSFQTKHHEGLVEVSPHKENELTSILSDTYGLLIYQEQLMKLVSTITSCSFGDADTFRRRMSDSPELVPKYEKWFFSKGKERYSRKELEPIWESIVKFAKYGFNKSHAVAYALISYKLAWIKTYYPSIFYSEFLSLSLNPECFKELEEIGFIVSPPTYGKSDFRSFKVIDNFFYFPISGIIGLPLTQEQYQSIPGKATNAMDAIKELIRCSIPLETIKTLNRAGFFNELFTKTESCLYFESNLEIIRDNSILKSDGTPLYDLDLQEVENTPEDKKRYRAFQKELLGVDISKGRIPLKLFEKYKSLSRINTLHRQKSSKAKYIGFLCEARKLETYREDLLIIRISDGFYTSPKITFFGPLETLQKWLDISTKQPPVIVDIEKIEDTYKAISIREIN